MADRRFHPETLAIHAGQIPDVATGARQCQRFGLTPPHWQDELDRVIDALPVP
jgi:hypothetical protein